MAMMIMMMIMRRDRRKGPQNLFGFFFARGFPSHARTHREAAHSLDLIHL